MMARVFRAVLLTAFVTMVAADGWAQQKPFEQSVGQARAILAAERLRRQRQPGLTDFVGQFRSRR